MSDSYFMVHPNPVEGKDEEFNDWYNTVHLAEMAALPSVTSCQRYRMTTAQSNPDMFIPAQKYVAIYKIIAGEEAEFLEQMQNALPSCDPRIALIARTSVMTFMMEAISEEVS